MGGSSGKSSNKQAEQVATPSIATNPNYIPMQQPQPFAPGMQQMLANQLAQGYGSPGLLGSSAQDFNGLLTSIYSPQAIAADPIGVAQSIATATKAAKPSLAQAQSAPPNEGLRGGSNMGGQR
jgi:hypothetical protein